jgi:hypothetical protein
MLHERLNSCTDSIATHSKWAALKSYNGIIDCRFVSLGLMQRFLPLCLLLRVINQGMPRFQG